MEPSSARLLACNVISKHIGSSGSLLGDLAQALAILARLGEWLYAERIERNLAALA